MAKQNLKISQFCAAILFICFFIYQLSPATCRTLKGAFPGEENIMNSDKNVGREVPTASNDTKEIEQTSTEFHATRKIGEAAYGPLLMAMLPKGNFHVFSGREKGAFDHKNLSSLQIQVLHHPIRHHDRALVCGEFQDAAMRSPFWIVWEYMALNLVDSLDPSNILFKKSVYQNGTVYMISDYTAPYRCPYPLAYNIQNREGRFLKVPKKARKEVGHSKRSTAGIFKNSSKSIGFVILIDNVFTVWFLIDKKKGFMEAGFQKARESYGTDGDRSKGDRTNNGSRVEEVFGQGCGEWDNFYSYTSSLRPCLPDATKLSAQILKET
ncbi:unnamed protein product [Fraxinus pennsylvanica]|uniref:Uncharacterized protein n=1 Tax=Fraxinus pennsylvanica TaxID=56036 RepID=A0AAD2DUV7_9LAMI|nr:unnamed protein product [Fraxinus pennsylvanica]